MDFGGAAPLRPLAEAIRHFQLPPYDGRPLSASSGDLEGSEVDARLVLGEDECSGKAEAAAAASREVEPVAA